MKYASVCSGVGAPELAWKDLGWQSQWMCEFDKFPSAVLAHHYPEIPNLGDMTKLFENKEFIDSQFDLFVGGSPCQAFSVAGKRESDEDERGALIYTFLDIVEIKRPRWVVWENVPGFLSAKNNVFEKLAQGFNRLGYALDADILDAQHFGVPQRRRRVFFVCQDVKNGRKMKSNLFATTALQCLMEILLKSLIEALGQYDIKDRSFLAQDIMSRDGLITRMKLLGIMPTGQEISTITSQSIKSFLKDLEDTLAKSLKDAESLESLLEDSREERPPIGGDQFLRLKTEERFSDIAKSWKVILEDQLKKEKLFTTSTETSQTTQLKISFYVETLLNTLEYIVNSLHLPKNLLRSVLSTSTELKRNMKYARQANVKKGEDFQGCGVYLDDFYGRTESLRVFVVGYLGDWRPSYRVLFESEGLRGNIAESSKKKQEDSRGVRESSTFAVRTAQTSSNGCGINNKSYYILDGANGQAVCTGIKGTGPLKASQGGQQVDGMNQSHTSIYVPHDNNKRTVGTLLARDHKGVNTFDIEEGKFAYAYSKSHRKTHVDVRFTEDGKANCLNTGDGCSTQSSMNIALTQNCSKAKEVTQTLTRSYGSGGPDYDTKPLVFVPLMVRKLTPIECERLQGFPDNFTQIPWRGKEAKDCPKGPRYKAMGNSMAVPVMKWIGKRIDQYENRSKK